MPLLKRLPLILTLLLLIAVFGCGKDDLIDTDPAIKLGFSTDTVVFDTVFTSLGSSTQRFTVHNPSKNRISVTSVKLARGDESPFSLNVNGRPGSEVKDVEINGSDSAIVMVKVTIDPNNSDSPLIQEDELVFETNGNRQEVKLIAWGQDARFMDEEIVFFDQVFDASKPYVVNRSLVVADGATLTVQEGTRIHMHRGASIHVFGTLKINGTLSRPVIIEGDRLEKEYDHITEQWEYIYLRAGSTHNRIDHAVIRNGRIGLVADTVFTPGIPTVTLSNTQIVNMSENCLLGRGSHIVADNCLFANSGKNTLMFRYGGTYEFRHCTAANYWQSFRNAQLLYMDNFYQPTGLPVSERPLYVYFGNSIIYGTQEEELRINVTGSKYAYLFDHALLKTKLDVQGSSFKNVTVNEDPLYDRKNTQASVFVIDTVASAAINRGDPAITQRAPALPLDLRGNSRLADSKPDLGAYEYAEKKEE